MALFLSPLPRTTTAAICSSSSLLVTSFNQHLAPHPCSTPPLRLLRLYRVPSLQLSPSNFYAGIQLLARNSITTTNAPHQRCQHLLKGALQTRQQDNKLTTLLAILLISICDALLTPYALLPSHLSVDSHHAYFKLSHTHQIILKILKIFIAEIEFWIQITLAQLVHLTKGVSTRPRVPYYSPKLSGLATFLALLLIAVRSPLVTTSTLLPGQLLNRLPLEISPLASA